METQNTVPHFGKSPESGFRANLADAAHFWEPRRLIYNLLLTAVALFWLIKTWPHFRPAPLPSSLFRLAVLALLANVCYCAAYLVDIPMQQATARAVWGKCRWLLFVLGSICAMLLESYWILDEIYPDFG
jgi:hypothetical protein